MMVEYILEYMSDGMEYSVAEIVSYINARQNQRTFTDGEIRRFLAYHSILGGQRTYFTKVNRGRRLYYCYNVC